MPDRDGYPTEEELTRIREWPGEDPLGWFVFIRSCWWSADWGWTEYEGVDDSNRPQRVYRISTGGWSGNEEIIRAMRENFVKAGMLWSQTWQEHRRGGHYMFTVPLPSPIQSEEA